MQQGKMNVLWKSDSHSMAALFDMGGGVSVAQWGVSLMTPNVRSPGVTPEFDPGTGHRPYMILYV